MRLELENIGLLEKADVNIRGLTVIAGENDSGKSTIGKIVFSIVKAISRYKEDFKESREYKIQDLQGRIFFFLRRYVQNNEEFIFDKLQDIDFTLSEIDISYNLNKLNSVIDSLSMEQDERKYINSQVQRLVNILQTPEDEQKSIENALNKVFSTEFNSKILMFGKKSGYIRLYENQLLLLDINIDDNDRISLMNKVKPIEIREATFVETPLILNYHDLLIRSQTGLDITKRRSSRLGVPLTTLHTKDLFDKLRDIDIFSWFDDLDDNLYEDIDKVINGRVEYDDEEKDFSYIKNNTKIPIKNTATGIKSFGIIQLLIGNGFVNDSSILILDEPEIHLHPKWQLKYAEIIAALVKNRVNVFVTSHSPYMIEALKRYTDLDGLENNSNFYLAKDGIIENKNKLSDIFQVLSEPFDVFREMDRKELRDE